MEHIVLTDGELALMLKVSRPTIRRMWWRGKLPAPFKVGIVNRWRKSDIDAWLADQPRSNLYAAPDAVERKLV